MSDTTTTEPEATTATTDPTPTAPAVPESTVTEAEAAVLGDPGKKALDTERKARLEAQRIAAELTAKVKAFEDANKSETEKAAARAEAAEKRAAEAEAKALRLEVADELKVPANLRAFLTATDEDALREQASALMSELAAATASRAPKPDPTQGAKPGVGMDIDQQIAAATAAGNHALAISLKRQKAYAPTT